MLAQSADAQALEKTVIEGYNSKLAARAQSFAAANEGVSDIRRVVCNEYGLTSSAGENLALGF